MVEEGQNLSELPDIGDDLAEKIAVILDTGTLPLLEDLEDEINPAMADLMEIPVWGRIGSGCSTKWWACPRLTN